MPPMYRVVKGSIGHADVLFPHNSIVPDGVLTEKQIKSLLAEGVIKAEPEAPVAAPPAPPAPPAGDADPKPWSLNPKKLYGKALDELHVLIAEIDPKRTPPEDVARCIALLSRDFKNK